MTDLGTVHFQIKRTLHGKNLLSDKPRLCTGTQALRGRQNTGGDPGRIAKSFGKTHQFRQVIPQSGFTAGQLQQGRAALADNIPDGILQLLHGGVSIGAAAIGKAEAASEVAPLGHLQ